MAAKYLGTLGKWEFYIATTFAEYRDENAVREIQRQRYNLVTQGKKKKNEAKKPVDIFCTAIELDHGTKREISYFDDLDTTYHVFAIKNKRGGKQESGKFGGACSVAIESKETIDGAAIGLPQENKVRNNYPQGFDLDKFRKKYKYTERKTCAEERVELFRYFKNSKYLGDKVSSIGILKGVFHELITKRKRVGKTPATKWLFCSKPGYYEYLYRPVGCMLIKLLLNGNGDLQVSPSLKEIKALNDNDTEASGGLKYGNCMISYRYPIKISRSQDKAKQIRWFDYIPLLVDCDRASDIIKNDKFFSDHKQVNWIPWRVIGEGFFLDHHNNTFDKALNLVAKTLIRAHPYKGWDALYKIQ